MHCLKDRGLIMQSLLGFFHVTCNRRLIILLLVLGGILACSNESNLTKAKQQAERLRLFGVEIGGPEDGFSLTDRSKFESAKRVGARFIDLRPLWAVLEPRPDEYDWNTLDVALENAASVHLPVTITMRFFEEQIPAWLAGESTLDQDGNSFFGYRGKKSRSLSYWAPRGRQAYLQLVKAIVERYRDNRAILAWQFFYGYNDSFYLGMWQGRQTVYDYSPFSQEKYRHYLAHVKKMSLDELNQRYLMNHQDWSEVAQPKPTFGTLNVSKAWHDFQDYRMWSIERMFADIDSTVRSLDHRPLIMYYGGSLHHAAHQLSVYDIGLRLLSKFGGALDITCFEDPVPAEVGSGLVRQYGILPMAEAWQVPPPLPSFRRMFFHIFSLGVKSYQMVGSWEKMAIPAKEFQRTGEVFLEMAEAKPVRARVAGIISYRTILSHIPAKPYINPTLAMIPVLQEHQFSLDWRSNLTSLADLQDYPAVIDANSEVMEKSTIDSLSRYVSQGGRLVLLARSGRYSLEDGRSDYPLLEQLQCPKPQSSEIETWSFGKGQIMRIGKEMDWKSPEGTSTLLRMMDWLGVKRPITATPGVLAAVSGGSRGALYVILHWPNAQPFDGSFALRKGLVDINGHYRISNLFDEAGNSVVADGRTLENGMPVSFAAHELKVLKVTRE